MDMQDRILQVKNLKTYFYTARGTVKAVDEVSFDIEPNSVFGLVGESGSGKTLTALSIMRLVRAPGKIACGSIFFSGIDLVNLDEEEFRAIRGSKIAMVFQEPASALNPVFTVGNQIMEAILAHRRMPKLEAKKLSLEFLDKVHIRDPVKIYHDYPHQLSGGTKQRAMIAMAFVNSPELLILDEPTTALDVTIQAQVLDLLDEIIESQKISILFISHDLGIIARMCDHVAIMNKGRIVETGRTDQILHNPKEPYTISLLESVKAIS